MSFETHNALLSKAVTLPLNTSVSIMGINECWFYRLYAHVQTSVNDILEGECDRIIVSVFINVVRSRMQNIRSFKCSHSYFVVHMKNLKMYPPAKIWKYTGLIIMSITQMAVYSILQDICTRFCCALLCCGYAIVHNEFTWSIYLYSSGLLCWHWGNR